MKVSIIGASLGGLVAAAELRKQGFDVTIYEKSRTIGGLYNKVETPFGVQDLGMHVLYVSNEHYKHLSDIFGINSFHVLTGCNVDIGACANFDTVFFDSLYPNVKSHSLGQVIFSQLKEASGKERESRNAFEEVVRRFGKIGGEDIVAPILKKLWRLPAELLTKNAIHCFFDLRRMIVCDKEEADILKSDPWFDEIVGNPVQSQPSGKVYGGRLGLTFKTGHGDLLDSVMSWANQVGITIEFEKSLTVKEGSLLVGGVPVHEDCDACIVAVPMHSLATSLVGQADQLELSIYYLQLAEKLQNQFPAYYILGHAEQLKFSRLVNYDAYNGENTGAKPSILAVEALHEAGNAPSEVVIADEITQLIPGIRLQESYRLPQSVKVWSPTLKNAKLLDSVRDRIERQFGSVPVYFSGMRTDTGIFFSHHTIGLAYDSALECCKRLS